MMAAKGITPGSTEGSGERISPLLWTLFIVFFLSNVMGGAASTLMAVYLPVVVHDLAGDSTRGLEEIGAYINALYLLGWTFGGFTWGLLSDRFGRIRSFLVSFGLVGLFTLLIAFASSWESVVVLRFFTGFCVGGVLVVTNAFLSEVWPLKSRAIILGILSIGFPVGIFSAGLTNYLFSGWRTGFLTGFFPVALSLVSLGIFRKLPDLISRGFQPAGSFRIAKVFNDNHQILWKGSVLFGSMLIGMWAVFSWLPTWVQSLLDGPDGQMQRSLCMMLLGMGGLGGGFASGWVARGLGIRRAMMLCFAGCMVLTVVLFGLNREFTPVIFVETAVLALFFGISQGLLSIYIPQLFAPVIRGTATGFCYNTGRIFTTAAVFFIGALVTLLGGYSRALLVFSLIFIIGLITMYYSSDLQPNTSFHGTHRSVE